MQEGKELAYCFRAAHTSEAREQRSRFPACVRSQTIRCISAAEKVCRSRNWLLFHIYQPICTQNTSVYHHTVSVSAAPYADTLNTLFTSGGQGTQIKYLSKSIIKYYTSTIKSTAFSILLEWKYKSTHFFMYLSKKVLIDLFCSFVIDYFITFYICAYFYNPTAQNTWDFPQISTI